MTDSTRSDGHECPECGYVSPTTSGVSQHYSAAHGGTLPDEYYLDTIRQVGERLSKTPSVQEFRKNSDYAPETFIRKFGSWPEAVSMAGFEPLPRHRSGEDHHWWKGGEAKCVCEHCGNDYTMQRSYVERTRFCSKQCRYEWMSQNITGENIPHYNRVELVCPICNSEFSIPKSRESERITCSSECGAKHRSITHTGEDNPAWKGGPAPYGEGWNETKRRQVRIRDQGRCQHCGRTESEHIRKFGAKHSIHHITPARQIGDPADRNAMENLITLCRGECHHTWEKMAPLRPDPSPAVE